MKKYKIKVVKCYVVYNTENLIDSCTLSSKELAEKFLQDSKEYDAIQFKDKPVYPFLHYFIFMYKKGWKNSHFINSDYKKDEK